MVRPTTPQPPVSIYVTSKQMVAGIGDSMIGLFTSCSKKAKKQLCKAAQKLHGERANGSSSALARSKGLFASVHNKASRCTGMKMKTRSRNSDSEDWDEFGVDDELWNRTILMGDKCQPLNFPGVIYYDGNGKVMSEPPNKSPRASSFAIYE